jgi:hypothetical protein
MGYEAVVSDSDLALIDAAVPSNLWRWGISETAFVKTNGMPDSWSEF